MQRINTSKLIQLLIEQKSPSGFFILLSDNPLFPKLISDQLLKTQRQRPKIWEGKEAIKNYYEFACQGNLFDPPQESLIILQEKWTQKQWTAEKKRFEALPQSGLAATYVLAPTSMRQLLSPHDFPKKQQFYLCYDPNDEDLPKSLDALLAQYPSLARLPQTERQNLVRLAIEHYAWDLLSSDSHFERMETANLSFQGALSSVSHMNAFHVIDVLVKKDLHQIESTLTQCASNGIEASAVLAALTYFLKQVLAVQCNFEKTKNIKNAFESAKIPFPAQARIQKALPIFQIQRLHSYFLTVSQLELELREQKKPHLILAEELIRWIS